MSTHTPPEPPVALVTGGSRGIGTAIARRLARDGHRVAISYRNDADAAARAADAIATESAWPVTTLKADCSRSADVNAMFDELESTCGPAAVLVNNAGMRADGLALTMSDEAWSSVVSANLDGTFYCTRRALKRMVRARSGRIVNIGSVVSEGGSPGQGNYAASKAGIVGLSRSVAAEVAGRNITVNVVLPGPVGTDILADLSEQRRKELVGAVPMNRMASVDEIAGAVAFLCGADAAYITGATLRVDGGMCLSPS